jgi:rRNA-processing protein FCF1
MREKIIFDTNIARNIGVNTFLGNREILEHFLVDADIVLPDTVVEEIKRQKRSHLKSNSTKFISNPFHNLFGLNEEDTKSFDIESYINKLIDEESIPFEVIDIKDNNILPRIKELAIQKKAPFENGEGTDKGFKDALIYFSVLEYVQEIENKYVFVCANDNRLGEAFKNHPNIIVIKNYDEFKKHSISQFFDNYMIQKFNDELGFEISKNDIKEYWNNINDNKVVLIHFEDEEYVLETESGEILCSCNRNEYIDKIQTLALSPNFATTHTLIEELVPYQNYFSEDEIERLLGMAYINNQIGWILGDDDVKQFFGNLYESKKHLVRDELAIEFLNNIFR